MKLFDKLLLSIDPKGDSTLQDFKTLLSAFRGPQMVEDSAKARVRDPVTNDWRDRTSEEMKNLVWQNAIKGKSRVGKVVGPTYRVEEREETAMEWLEAFMEVIYLDEARVNHYKDMVDDMSIVLPPLSEGLPAANTALNRHVVRLRTLMKFAKIYSPATQKRLLLKTFRKDQGLYREASRGTTWEEVIQVVRRELDSRVSAHGMGHLQLNEVHSARGEEEKPRDNVSAVITQGGGSRDQDIRGHLSALAALGVTIPKNISKNFYTRGARGRSKMSQGRDNRQERTQERGQLPRRQGRGARERGPQGQMDGTCHWCGIRGHPMRLCQSRLAGTASVFPPKPAEVTWEAHKAANPPN